MAENETKKVQASETEEKHSTMKINTVGERKTSKIKLFDVINYVVFAS